MVLAILMIFFKSKKLNIEADGHDFRWKKPKRSHLATRQYMTDYEEEMSKAGDDHILIYYGMQDVDLPESKGSLKESILQKLSITSASKIPSADRKSIISHEDYEDGDSDDSADRITSLWITTFHFYLLHLGDGTFESRVFVLHLYSFLSYLWNDHVIWRLIGSNLFMNQKKCTGFIKRLDILKLSVVVVSQEFF